eukprot:3127793-Rhodomonas_salina.2
MLCGSRHRSEDQDQRFQPPDQWWLNPDGNAEVTNGLARTRMRHLGLQVVVERGAVSARLRAKQHRQPCQHRRPESHHKQTRGPMAFAFCFGGGHVGVAKRRAKAWRL